MDSMPLEMVVPGSYTSLAPALAGNTGFYTHPVQFPSSTKLDDGSYHTIPPQWHVKTQFFFLPWDPQHALGTLPIIKKITCRIQGN